MSNIEFNGNILVVGDVMLDRYIEGVVNQVSPEAPAPVISEANYRSVAGGAANVAMNLSALGIKTTLVGVMGSDKPGEDLKDILISNGIDLDIVLSESSTTTKTRVLSGSHQLVRIDNDNHCTDLENTAVYESVLNHLPFIDLVLMSDYAKGAVANPQRIIKACIDSEIPIFIDPKNEDLTVYNGATLLKPNIHEFNKHFALSVADNDFYEYGNKLLETLGLEKLLVTRGEKGMSLFTPDNDVLSINEVSRSVFDVTGAGDTVFSVIGACFVSDKSDFESIKIASEAACLAVENIGTKVISIDELAFRMNKHELKSNRVFYSFDELAFSINLEKKSGKKIVFTNGCFDMIHSGHVSYLEEASSHGDILIVGLNSDDSVRRLKGQARPINSINGRAKVLSSLRCVDYVIEFDDDTPLSLIQTLLPDVLVKGGDYSAENIVGANLVIENGGSVEIAEFINNQSTSQMIQKIKDSKDND